MSEVGEMMHAPWDRRPPVRGDEAAALEDFEWRFWSACFGPHAGWWIATGALPALDWPPAGQLAPAADATAAPSSGSDDAGASALPDEDCRRAAMHARWWPVAAGPAASRWRRLHQRG